MFYIYFSCFVLCFYVFKNGFSSFRIFYFPVVMYLKNVFLSNKLVRDVFCFFSFLSCFFLLFCSLFFFKKSEIIFFIFGLFLKFLKNPFPPYFLTKKSAPNIHFSFSSLFFRFTCFLSTFSFFSIIIFFFDHFSFVCFPPCVVIFPCLSNVFFFFFFLFFLRESSLRILNFFYQSSLWAS